MQTASPVLPKPTTSTFFPFNSILSQFQCCQAEKGEYDTQDPETNHDFLFRPTQKLEVMVERGHFEDPFSSGQPEIGDLQEDRERFQDKNAGYHEKKKLLLDHDGDGSDAPSQGQCAHIAHEKLGRMTVEPEKAQAGS